MRRSPAPLPAALLAAVLLLAGCSSGSGDTGGSAAGGEQSSSGSVRPRADGADSSGAEAGQGGGQTAPDDPTAVLSGRVAPGASLVRTAELTVRVDDVRRAADAATRLVTEAGGVVQSEERSRNGGGDGGDGSALAVLRVPPTAFTPTLTRLSELGEEVDRRLGSTDVTEQVVDLDSRTATQRASVARVRALLDRAATVGEVVQVEGELTRRTADLESLEARRAALEGQVDLATITLSLVGQDGAVLADGRPQGFGDGLAAGWAAMRALGRALGVTAGAVLPFAPLLLLAVLLWRLRVRRAVRPAAPTGA